MFISRKRRPLLLVGIALGIAGVVVLARLRPQAEVSRVNFAKIANGMDLKEVSALFGRPSVEAKPNPIPGSYDPLKFQASGAVETRFWYSKELTAQVGFDAAGVVVWRGESHPPIPRWRSATRFERLWH
jgi:hypothetical protein